MTTLARIRKMTTKQLALFCRQCQKEKIKSGRIYCSNTCSGLAKRGRARGDQSKPAKHHIRIRLENGGREYLHRIIFQENVRPLEKGEIVHHINENKFDNRVENLEAVNGRAEHLARHNYYRDLTRAELEEIDYIINNEEIINDAENPF